MPEYQTTAVILTIRDYGDLDRIVTFYTSDFGKVSGIAKGAKKSLKRFGAALDLFSHVSLSFFTKETLSLVRINHCHLKQSFPSLHKDITSMGYGSYMAELINELTAERVSHRELFQTLLKLFSLIDSSPLKEDYLRIFEMRFLVASGFRPTLTHCLDCKRKLEKGPRFWFNIPRGGVMCSSCSLNKNNLYPVSLGTLKLLEQAGNLTLDKIERLIFSSQALEESREFMPHFVQYHLGKELKSLKFLEKMRSGF